MIIRSYFQFYLFIIIIEDVLSNFGMILQDTTCVDTRIVRKRLRMNDQFSAEIRFTLISLTLNLLSICQELRYVLIPSNSKNLLSLIKYMILCIIFCEKCINVLSRCLQIFKKIHRNKYYERDISLK